MRAHGLRADVLTYMIIILDNFRAQHVDDVLMLLADIVKLGFLPKRTVDNVLFRAY